MSLNRGSSMTAKCKGIKRSAPQRARMPWTEPREPFAACILSRRDRAILDGKPAFANANGVNSTTYAPSTARSTMLEPLDALKAVIAQREYNVSTGKTLFQLATHMRHSGRGLRFYRKEWKEGTYDKHVTLAAVNFNRDGSTGDAYGYITFHGETSLFPVEVENANLPGWYVLPEDASIQAQEKKAVPFDRIVPPPPSEGTDVPVDVKRFRLKSYPFYDAPNPAEFVSRLLRERGVVPDLIDDNNSNNNAAGGEDVSGGGDADGSEHRGAN